MLHLKGGIEPYWTWFDLRWRRVSTSTLDPAESVQALTAAEAPKTKNGSDYVLTELSQQTIS